MGSAVDRPVGVFRQMADDAGDLELLSLPDLLERQAEAAPDAPLIDFFGRVFPYDEVMDLARRVATGLAAMGIRPGDRVGLCLPNLPYYVVAYYGALRLGAVVVNFPPRLSSEELRRQVEHSGTRVIFTLSATGYLPRALDLLKDNLLEMLIVGSLAGCLPGARAFFQRLFGRDALPMPASDRRISSFDALIDNDGSVPKIGVDPRATIALIQYSSGDPRGAAFSHQALSANARQMAAGDCDGRGPRERSLCVLPLSEMIGQVCALNRVVAQGGEMVMLTLFHPAEMIAAIRRTRVQCLPASPAMLRALLDHPGLSRADVASLEEVIVAGAPLPRPLRDRFAAFSDARLIETCGTAEAGIISCRLIDGRAKPALLGHPLPATRVAVVNPDPSGGDPSAGETGEIVVGGPQIMSGYWRDDDLSPFIERKGERWLRTGYMGSIDTEGQAHIVDPVRDIISVTGFRVYPSQIEAILRRHPAVEQALVIGVPDHYAGELPKAFVTLAMGVSATEPALCAWLNARVGKHEQLAGVVICEALPQDHMGGPDRRALARQEAARAEISGSGAA